MTPKEKAKELVDQFDELLTYRESKTKTKQCALIAVDEILTLYKSSEFKNVTISDKDIIKMINHYYQSLYYFHLIIFKNLYPKFF